MKTKLCVILAALSLEACKTSGGSRVRNADDSEGAASESEGLILAYTNEFRKCTDIEKSETGFEDDEDCLIHNTENSKHLDYHNIALVKSVDPVESEAANGRIQAKLTDEAVEDKVLAEIPASSVSSESGDKSAVSTTETPSGADISSCVASAVYLRDRPVDIAKVKEACERMSEEAKNKVANICNQDFKPSIWITCEGALLRQSLRTCRKRRAAAYRANVESQKRLCEEYACTTTFKDGSKVLPNLTDCPKDTPDAPGTVIGN